MMMLMDVKSSRGGGGGRNTKSKKKKVVGSGVGVCKRPMVVARYTYLFCILY